MREIREEFCEALETYLNEQGAGTDRLSAACVGVAHDQQAVPWFVWDGAVEIWKRTEHEPRRRTFAAVARAISRALEDEGRRSA